MRPLSPFGRPVASFVHVAPPSVRPVDVAARAAAVEAPRLPLALIRRREQRLRILRIHDDVGGTGVVVDEQHVVPGPAAIGRFEHAPLGVRAPQMADRRDIHDVRIAGMNDDAADVPRLVESDVRPRAAGVDRFVDAVAPRRALPVVGFARARPDDVRVRRRHREVADRHHRVHAVEDRRPRRALIRALEDPAARRADVDRVGCARHAGDREIVDAASGVRRTDAAKSER